MWTILAIVIHIKRLAMKTFQMTLDEDLVKAVDRVAKRLRTSRSAFTREALREALARHQAARLEEKHRKGYENKPVREVEFAVWEAEQAWGDE
jgi:Arc/MetJ-type ribon-helix-helix transcriptional regulator